MERQNTSLELLANSLGTQHKINQMNEEIIEFGEIGTETNNLLFLPNFSSSSSSSSSSSCSVFPTSFATSNLCVKNNNNNNNNNNLFSPFMEELNTKLLSNSSSSSSSSSSISFPLISWDIPFSLDLRENSSIQNENKQEIHQNEIKIPPEIVILFQNLILELLQCKNKNIYDFPFHPNADILHSEYDLLYRIMKFLSTNEETKRLLQHLNRSKVALLISIILKNMIEKKLILKTNIHKFTLIYPHLFLIRFDANSIEYFIHETLCETMGLQQLHHHHHHHKFDIIKDPITAFQIKSSFDESYPSFQGQTLFELVNLCQKRASTSTKANFSIFHKNLNCIIEKSILKMINLNLLTTNAQFQLFT